MDKIKIDKHEISLFSPQVVKNVTEAFSNPVIRSNWERWSNELKSNLYKQTTNKLIDMGKDGNSYCCLGVACEMYVKEGIGHWDTNGKSWTRIQFPDNQPIHSGIPTTFSIEQFGLPLNTIHDQFEALFRVDRGYGTECHWHFEHLNDKAGFTFSQIAELIDWMLATYSPKEPNVRVDAP